MTWEVADRVLSLFPGHGMPGPEAGTGLTVRASSIPSSLTSRCGLDGNSFECRTKASALIASQPSYAPVPTESSSTRSAVVWPVEFSTGKR